MPTGFKAVATSFGVLLLAEWGDLSQLFTAGLVVRYEDPVSVFVGAWLALLLISGIAALVGRALLQRIRLGVIQRVAAGVRLLLAALTVIEVVRNV